jgi:hypothetical protein
MIRSLVIAFYGQLRCRCSLKVMTTPVCCGNLKIDGFRHHVRSGFWDVKPNRVLDGVMLLCAPSFHLIETVNTSRHDTKDEAIS